MSSSNPQEAATTAQPCKYLLSKGMYTTGEVIPQKDGRISDGNCWCAMTQHALGPDDKGVGRAICDSSRKCYVACL